MDEIKLPLLETIYHLRTIEEVILYTKVLQISNKEEMDTLEFLRDEYEKERVNYPFQAPNFNEEAAYWASKIVYFSVQLLLNREDKEKQLQLLLPNFKGTINASSCLSADLCLRFLPQIVEEMKQLDSEDKVNPILEEFLEVFHYSNIGYEPTSKNLHFNWFDDKCYQQLYLNRVYLRKDKVIAQHPEINLLLLSNFGNYKKVFWKELEIIEKE